MAKSREHASRELPDSWRVELLRVLLTPREIQGIKMTTDETTAALNATAESILAGPLGKLDALRKKKEQIEERIRQISERESVKSRKTEAIRLILTGRAVMEWSKRDPEFSRKLRENLNEFATRPRDRKLLGLPTE